jgi:hypothetical protein
MRMPVAFEMSFCGKETKIIEQEIDEQVYVKNIVMPLMKLYEEWWMEKEGESRNKKNV